MKKEKLNERGVYWKKIKSRKKGKQVFGAEMGGLAAECRRKAEVDTW